jgi:hypothetical protein
MSTEDGNTSQAMVNNTIRALLGSAAASFLAVVQILTLPSLDTPLNISLFSFGISIPINIGISTLMVRLPQAIPARFALIGTINLLVSLTGFAAIFWHFSWKIGIVFIISTSVAVFLYIRGRLLAARRG